MVFEVESFNPLSASTTIRALTTNAKAYIYFLFISGESFERAIKACFYRGGNREILVWDT